MTDIITKIANEKFVEKLLQKHTDFSNNPYIDDFAQDIYICLLETDNETIEKLYSSNELEYYIKRIIKNNLYSKTSPFFYKYERFRKITDEIGENLDEEI